MKLRTGIGIAVPSALILGTFAYCLLQIRQMKGAVLQARWEQAIADHARDSKEVGLDVGVIQFIPGGYSITLDSVTYDPVGVTLVGKIGNQNALNVSSLTLNLEVRREFWTRREQFMRLDGDIDFLLSDSTTVGKAQVAVGDLAAGTQTTFRASIPNVKQTQEKYVLAISFSGERYSYLR